MNIANVPEHMANIGDLKNEHVWEFQSENNTLCYPFLINGKKDNISFLSKGKKDNISFMSNAIKDTITFENKAIIVTTSFWSKRKKLNYFLLG